MPPGTADNQQLEQEVSLKDLIYKIKDWQRYFVKKWGWILLGTLVVGGIGFSYAYSKKMLYVADLTFVVEEHSSSAMGGYASLANQFGLDLGSSGGSGVFSGDNVMEFLRSRLMIEKVLLSSVDYQGQKITLGDLFIKTNGIAKKWDKRPELANFAFPLNAEPNALNRLQDSVLGLLHEIIIVANLKVTKPDKKLSFVQVECLTPNEIFSKLFTERLVSQATKFYIDSRTQRSQESVDRLERQSDSILYALNKSTYSAAAGEDLNLNPSKHIATVNAEFATRDKNILTVMYEEVRRNLEMSKINLAQETPIIQIVDSPQFPLKKAKPSILIFSVAGCIVGALFTVFGLGVSRIFSDLTT